MIKRRAVSGEALAYYHSHLGEASPDCLLWPFASSSSGYGHLTLDGKTQRVHSLACAHRWGPRPTGMQATHGRLVPCLSKLCWNGEHLSWRSPADNAGDQVRYGFVVHGDDAPWSKLSAADIPAIRAAVAAGVSHQALADSYGVSRPTISLAVSRKNWARI